MDNWFEEQSMLNEKFWNEKYPIYTLEERVLYWSGQVYQSMRWQGESTGDEYEGVFSKEWWDYACSRDPEFPVFWQKVALRAGVDLIRANKLIGI